jgi:hypothetical protein
LTGQQEADQNKFRVVCFTETPLDQIDLLLSEVEGRVFKPKPYGLVFKKAFIRKHGGNPIFYVGVDFFDFLWKIYEDTEAEEFPLRQCRFLALVNRCDSEIDFHWEREWRVVGDLEFSLDDIYCGLCPEEDISYFERTYHQITFLSPRWKINKILDRLVNKDKRGESTLI